MRPDEHKTRKNTQYKKKHGIPVKADNKQHGADDAKAKTSQKGKTKCQEDEKLAKTSQPTQRRDDSVKKATSEVFEDEDTKQFQRRSLVSNWSRYDDIPSDDEADTPLQRGEDFNKLLAEAGGSASQFRFKDEEDWSSDAGETTTNALALDFEHLAQAVWCIPLHERLGIAEDLFSREQLKEMTTAAAENKSMYEHNFPNTVTSETPVDICEVSNKDKVKTHKQDVKTNSEISASDQAHPVIKKQMTENTGSNSQNETDGHSTPKSVSVAKPVKKSLEVVGLEDDLDMLLSIDELVKYDDKMTAVASKTVINKDNTKEKPKATSGTLGHIVKEEKMENNLEDWLDSMLDD